MRKLIKKLCTLLICSALLICNNTVQVLAEEIDIVSKDAGAEQSEEIEILQSGGLLEEAECFEDSLEQIVEEESDESDELELSYSEILAKDAPFYYTLNEKNEATITGYEYERHVKIKDLIIPSTLDGYPVTAIGSHSLDQIEEFYGDLYIPDSVISIGEGAFVWDTGFDGTLHIGNSVKTIGESAFMYTNFTGDLIIPDSVVSIGERAFEECVGFNGDFYLGDGLEEIGPLAFYPVFHLKEMKEAETPIQENTTLYIGKKCPDSVAVACEMDTFSKVINASPNKQNLCCYHLYNDSYFHWIDEATGNVIPPFSFTYARCYIPSGVTALRREGKAPDGNTPGGDTFERWGFSNSSDNFGKEENGYCITENDHSRLLAGLPQTVKYDLAYEYNVGGSKPVGNRWSGSCYGMSTSVMRMHNGDDSIADYGLGSAKKLNDINAADSSYKTKGKDTAGAAESVINFYHYQQLLPEYQQIRAEYSLYSDATQVSKLADIAKKAQTDKKVALADLWWYENNRLQGHTINITGYRDLSSSESRYSTYPHCILTFDCSNPDSVGNSSDFNIYFNDSGEWTVPGWNITPENSYMLCGSGDTQITGPVDYKNGNYASASPMPANIDYHGDNGEWELVFDENDEQFVKFDGDQVVDDADDGLDVFVLPKMTDGNDDTYRIYVPEEKDYRIKGDVIDHTVHTEDHTVHVEAEEGGQASVYNDGKTEVVSDEKGQIVIDIVDNDTDNGSAHTVIRSDDAKELCEEKTENGIIIKGDNLKNAEIETENRKITIDTEEQSVLVKENDDRTLDVFVDTDDDGEYDEPIEANNVGLYHSEIAPQTFSGSQIKPSVSVYSENQLLREKTDYTIAYKNNVNVYTLTEKDAGFNAKTAPCVTITGKGNYSGTETIYFTISPKNITDGDVAVSDVQNALYNAKKDYKPVPSVTFGKKKLANKKDFTVGYYAGEECTAGTEVNPRSAGTYYIKITGIGNYTGETVKQFEIAEQTKKLASKLSVGKIAAQTYADGEEIKPEVVVKDGKVLLTEKTDSNPNGNYTVTYRNNTDVGTATVIITGADETYVGTKTATFNITGVSLSKAVMTGFEKSFDYDGTEMKQNITLTYTPKGKAAVNVLIAEQSDYDSLGSDEKRAYGAVVTYTDNVKAGTATMILTGVNGYTGTVKKTFKINPFDVKVNPGNLFTAELETAGYPYSKAGVKPEPVVKYNGLILTKGTDYTVTYSNNTVLSGNPKKVPTVKINGKGNFKGAAAELTFDIVAKSFDSDDISVSVNDKVYSNKAGNWKPSVSILDNGKKLSAGKDYDKDISYFYVSIPEGTNILDGSQKSKPVINKMMGEYVGDKDIVPAGAVIRLSVNAKGDFYTGTKNDITFRVVANDINKAKATIQPKTYTGKEITLAKDEIVFNVKTGDEPVTFEIVEDSYKNNINKGKATVVVRGTGNYGGTKTLTYTIGAKGFLWWFRDLFN